MKETSKILISQLFSELEKNWKSNPGLYLTNPIFHLFHELIKTAKFSWSNIQKYQNLFANWKKFGSTAYDQQ